MEKKIEIVSMEFIRPLSPTPNHLRCFEYSFLDQMAISLYAPLALFYPPPPNVVDASYSYEQARVINSSRLFVLKKSLSETLARYYPFAGRIKGISIECNDEGALFYEAFAHNYEFENVLRNLDVTKDFLPNTVVESGSTVFHNSTLYPLLVQVTLFKCGGMAICMCAFHKIADGATLYGLANAWATTARGSCNELPEFVAASKFLPPPIPYVSNEPTLQSQFVNFFCNEQRVSKLFTFDASTIALLRDKAVSDDVPVPTRVEAVSALIWKCVIRSNSGPSKLANLVNIRRRFVPPLPDHCVGNAVAVAIACKGENNGSDLASLVYCIRKSLSQLGSKYVDKKSQDETIFAIPHDFMELMEGQIRGEIALQVSSLCGYGSYADFGWGKPSWVSSNPRITTNTLRLTDSVDCGGIDARICLKDKEIMLNFQQELELQLALHLY
ncbi:vinorine synthase-like [Capsicum chacoense]